ncbi:hypothetical protein NEMIN01_0196 [Nematocida minor]|uniref:uncharacterized protein n=1 Tax=Nematocida minor TaxID=1912983 RepID=UPI002220AC5D|nr:uncharacterized protein NEMIN01_0092 [Nematocida minor]XP_051332098.1 uncharacterized protein NEMIN01_0196 [Nematocida minor]KAI5188828.1 hypothetical protein NEMIN01_0092 [Nematocida minor]KAI5188932.1 hypothetical protein NEMIN01_0196 [Nematocida minor]
MASLSDINWGKKETKQPINKTHPYQYVSFSNPKKRKIETSEHTGAPPPIIPTKPQILHSPPSPPARSQHEILLKANLVMQAYLNLIFNSFAVVIMILLVIKGFVMVKNDISIRIHTSTESQKAKILECRRQYNLNRCSPGERVPAVEKQCQAWEECMNQDPVRQEIGKIVLRLFSEGAEELMSALSARSVFLATFVLICVLKFRK